MSEAGNFDVRIMGTGDTRLDPLHFSVIGLSLDDIFSDFAAHVAGFDLVSGDCNHDIYGDDGCGDRITSAFFYGNRESVVPHESAYISLAGGGFDPNSSFKKALGTAVTTIPLPATVWLFGSGLIGLLGVARRRRN